MSAAELHAAADRLEHDVTFDQAHMDAEVAKALAAWLRLTAETPAFTAFCEGRSGSHVGKNIRAALTLARALAASP